MESSVFFRKGEVGDWKNYLTEEMAKKLDAVIAEKLKGSGLTFGAVYAWVPNKLQ
uniref:Sulfotransferase n=1 Tax=Oryza glumipatula TaxID=40148 RepID=A0A0E0AXL9_9ORYZ